MLMFMTPAGQGSSSNASLRRVLSCVLLQTRFTSPAHVADTPPQLWTALNRVVICCVCRQVFLPCLIAGGISRAVLENWTYSLAELHGLVRRVRPRFYYSIQHVCISVVYYAMECDIRAIHITCSYRVSTKKMPPLRK